MRKISWISCNGFLDTDLPIVARLYRYYKIRFIVVISHDSKIDYEDLVNQELRSLFNVEIEFYYIKHRLRSPKNILLFYHMIKRAKQFNPDLYYISYQGMPYALLLYKLMLSTSKIVVPCHNVTTPIGATNEKIAARTTRWWLNSFRNINVFSESQKQALLSAYPDKNVLMTPFFLKSYGEIKSHIDKVNSRPIRFLSFGNIVRYKRIDLLLEAVNLLVERGVGEFVVRIAGNCKNWKEYEKKIRYPDRFELMIHCIPNEDVPLLFADTHYFVLPYQDIAQSGSMTVAFNYNVPTIVSDIIPFKEFAIDKETGLTFNSQNAESLADIMEYAITHHHDIYDVLCKNQKRLVEEKFADDAIVKRYKTFFDSLM